MRQDIPNQRNRQGVTPRSDRLLVIPGAEGGKGERPISFGIPMPLVAEVVTAPVIRESEGNQPRQMGWADWRDETIPVMDLSAMIMTSGGSPAEVACLVVLRSLPSPGRFALGTPSSPRLLRLPVPHARSTRSLPIRDELVQGVVELFGETLLLPALLRVPLCQPTPEQAEVELPSFPLIKSVEPELLP